MKVFQDQQDQQQKLLETSAKEVAEKTKLIEFQEKGSICRPKS
jgi:hypothetical protein